MARRRYHVTGDGEQGAFDSEPLREIEGSGPNEKPGVPPVMDGHGGVRGVPPSRCASAAAADEGRAAEAAGKRISAGMASRCQA
jgi:hypothetical protein